MATVGGREQLRVLLDFVGKGDVLVVTKLDRLGRNLLDILVVIQEIEAKGAQLVSIGERFDTTSPMGVAMFQVAGVFAQLERAMIRLRQREEGWAVSGWQAALRSRNDPSALGDRHEAHQIKVELGCSFDAITRALRQHARPGTAAP